MAVRSKQLIHSESVTGTKTGFYNVPSGMRTIVKSMIFTNLDSAARIVIVYVQSGATELASFNVHLAASGTDGDTKFIDTWWVLDEGQSISMQTTGGTSRCIASGAELTL